MRKVANHLKRFWHSVRHRPVIQFSPGRTGSTLVYNALRLGYPDREIIKTHAWPRRSSVVGLRFPVVTTVRHPLDSLASWLLCEEAELTEERIVQRAIEYASKPCWRILDMLKERNLLVLRYERFATDLDYLLGEIECFMRQPLAEGAHEQFLRDFTIDAVAERANSLGAFANHSEVDLVHGRHVSRYRGASGYYREVFTPKQIKMLAQRMKPAMEALGYEA